MTSLDEEFKYFLSNMSCLSVLKLPYKDRCMMAKKLHDCHEIINYFNYFEMMYCFFNIHEKRTEICVMCLFVICVVSYMCLMSIIVDAYFIPVLKILSVKMHMNEYMAGVTLLAFGNSSPDLLANLMPIRAGSAMLAGAISNAVAIVLLCGGMVCYLKPFKMDGHSIVRDLLFLLLAVELVHLQTYTGGQVSVQESLFLILVYVVYLIINVADLKLMRFTIKKIRMEVESIRHQPISPRRDNKLREKIRILRDLQQYEVISILATSVEQRTLNAEQYELTRTILHRESNPKNLLICEELVETLSPITDWKLAGFFKRMVIIMRFPLLLITTIFVPVVNYERYKHGWSKLLNCTQIVTNPFVLITAVHSKFANVYNSWYIELNVNYSKWSFCLTLPLAFYVFFQARTDLPPPYHILFITLTASSSLVIIIFCAAEIEVLIAIVGIVFKLSDNFMDITLGAVTSATVNLFASFSTTMQGYEKMAFAAAFAGPFFNIVVGMGIAMLFNEKVHHEGSGFWLSGEQGDNCYIFIWITIATTLWWCLAFNFESRRSAAIFSWILFLLFLLYAIAAEWNIVHAFTRDQFYEPR